MQRRTPYVRHAVLACAAAAVLATGCTAAGTTATGTTAGTPDADAGRRPASTPRTTSPPDGRPTARLPEGTLLVTDFGADTVTFVDPDRGPLGSVEVGTAPYGLVVDEGGHAWVTTAEGVAVVDTERRVRVATVPYRTTGLGPATGGEYRGGGMGIALSPDGRHAYVGVNVPSGDGALETVDTARREVTASVPVGRRPFDVDVAPDGGEVYTTDHDSFGVTAVPTGGDGAADGAPRRIEVAPYGTEGGLGSWLKPHYAVVRPSDGRLLLPFEGERLVVLDPVTGRYVTEPMTAGTHQHGAALTPDGTLLVVGTGPVDPAEDAGPSLTVRGPDGEETVIPLDGPHENVAVSRDGRTAYVTGGFTRDGYWNGITVVDLGSHGTRRLDAGERPSGIAVL
ncbi:hypothetical protein [Streptomyces sp. CRN 30]|uniref:YncE family protein n=1 Tax=Streptomyces sp. CRN 30 TaxID=3075613 RepID=UPI002A7FB938|nr:hypothetical protein [Streptomyces sp. CRN 30]